MAYMILSLYVRQNVCSCGKPIKKEYIIFHCGLHGFRSRNNVSNIFSYLFFPMMTMTKGVMQYAVPLGTLYDISIFKRNTISNRKERSLFSKLRLGILQLEIETGRHTKPITESSKRFCKLCNSNKIGNECHFLFECPALETTRKPLLENILNTHRHLIFLSSEEKTKYLFFNNQLGNPTLLTASTLLWKLFATRSALLQDVQVVEGQVFSNPS